MPRVAKWIGDAMESILASKYLPVVVSKVECITPQIKRIRFRGDFRQLYFSIGYAVAFRVNDTDFRNYTPAYFDSAKGICDILFHIHGKGPGSHFANKLLPNQELKMIMPRGKKMYQAESPFHFFFGDETSLGLFQLMAQQVRNDYTSYAGILELDRANLYLPAQLGLDVKAVMKTPDTPGKDAVDYLKVVGELWPEFWKIGMFYLVGNAASIQAFRNALRNAGVHAKQIKTQAYWAEGKTGL